MSYELSALDMHYLVKELQAAIGARADKIYNPEKKELLIQLFLTGMGKKILRINAPGFIYLTDVKADQPERPSGFATLLRKYLDMSRLIEISQIGFERIIELVFDSKGERFRLILELFSKGNIVFCRDDYTIIMPVESQEWKERSIKPKARYVYPKKEFDTVLLTEEDLKKIVERSQKNIVKTIAIELGLGGLFAEELCMLSGVQKDKDKIDDDEIKRIIAAKNSLFSEKSSPRIIFKDGALKVISPIALSSLQDLEVQEFKTYNEALDYAFTHELVKDTDEKRLSGHQSKIDKVQKIISKQEEYLGELEKDIAADTKKGEAIYTHYQMITEIVAELNKARKKFPMKEIKEKLKDHMLVKDIKEKEKVAVLELD
jgi:predicted ribosome quality control (RQC) complex YloA/Tae2 family protein